MIFFYKKHIDYLKNWFSDINWKKLWVTIWLVSKNILKWTLVIIGYLGMFVLTILLVILKSEIKKKPSWQRRRASKGTRMKI